MVEDVAPENLAAHLQAVEDQVDQKMGEQGKEAVGLKMEEVEHTGRPFMKAVDERYLCRAVHGGLQQSAITVTFTLEVGVPDYDPFSGVLAHPGTSERAFSPVPSAEDRLHPSRTVPADRLLERLEKLARAVPGAAI